MVCVLPLSTPGLKKDSRRRRRRRRLGGGFSRADLGNRERPARAM